MQRLAESWDVVEVIRSLVTEVDSLQKIVAGQEARLQVLERPAAPRPLVTVGDLVAEPEMVVSGAVGASPTTAPLTTKATGRVKGEAALRKA